MACDGCSTPLQGTVREDLGSFAHGASVSVTQAFSQGSGSQFPYGCAFQVTLLAVATGDPLDPATLTPPSWRELATRRRPDAEIPLRLTDDAEVAPRPWQPEGGDAIDRAVLATRRAVFPLLGLDPFDPRD